MDVLNNLLKYFSLWYLFLGIKETITGKEPLIEYMVWALNKLKILQYVKHYGLNGPVKEAKDLVFHVREKYKQFNYETTYDMLLKDFRKGSLGKISLDELDFLREKIDN